MRVVHAGQNVKSRSAALYRSLAAYIEVLKPRESLLLTFLGVSGALMAGGLYDSSRLLITVLAIALGCEGCNGLTNYLDRNLDTVMRRTCTRSLPSRRIQPPQKVLPLTLGLLGAGLAISWFLNPVCFLVGAAGTIAAVVWRKTMWTHLLGSISGVAPLLIGWLAVNPRPDWTLALTSLLVAFWVPLHVWSVMVANRQDYLKAGLTIFPVTWPVKSVVKIFLLLSVILTVLSIVIYAVGSFSWIYLAIALLLGLVMLYTNWRLMLSTASRDAWKVYKLSAYPYLGIMFAAMAIERLVR
ncbi:MAG: protoheme IX farnesyltransferase [Chloroflexi bacterium]|nr:protoheme IX farnesyltransferase [Chloroflexota bacterium]